MERRPGTTCKGERLSHRVRTRERDQWLPETQARVSLKPSMLQSDIIYIKSLIHSAAYSHASHQPSNGSRRKEWVAEDLAATPSAWRPVTEAAGHLTLGARLGWHLSMPTFYPCKREFQDQGSELVIEGSSWGSLAALSTSLPTKHRISKQAQYFRYIDQKNCKTHWHKAISSALNYPYLKEV